MQKIFTSEKEFLAPAKAYFKRHKKKLYAPLLSYIYKYNIE